MVVFHSYVSLPEGTVLEYLVMLVCDGWLASRYNHTQTMPSGFVTGSDKFVISHGDTIWW